MNRLPALTALLIATTLALAACGGSQSGQSGSRDSSSPPEQSQPATQSEATEPAPEESAQSENAQGEDAQGGGEEAGTSVTTLDGEQVSIGEGNEATALFFMAGW